MLEVYSTPEKVYVNGPKGCLARLCVLSAEFYKNPDPPEFFNGCSFEKFQEEAKLRGYIIGEEHRPSWAKKDK